MSDVLPFEPTRLGPARSSLVRGSVLAGRLLSHLPPAALRTLVTRLGAGAAPADHDQARKARDSVLTASPYARGGSACLPRSLATVLVCRSRGVMPDWCVGVLSTPPFTAHAWIEVDGQIVDEPMSSSDFATLFSVGAGSAPTVSPRS